MPRKKDLSRGPDYHDADVLLKLYELRREPELRKARDWVTQQFKPSGAGEIMMVLRASGTDHNRWLRQFITYYEMVLRWCIAVFSIAICWRTLSRSTSTSTPSANLPKATPPGDSASQFLGSDREAGGGKRAWA
jgi:hypothetical protein